MDDQFDFQRLVRQSKAISLLIDPDTGRIIDANAAAVRFYGYSREQLQAMHILDINILSKVGIAEEMQRAKDERRDHFFFRHRLASGETRDVEVWSGPVELGDRTLLYSIIHDITDRKRAEERVRILLSAMEQVGEAIMLTDKQGIVEYLNPAFTRITGYAGAEAMGRMPGVLRSDAQDAHFYQNMWKTIQGGGTWRGRVIDKRKDGSPFPAMLTMSPIVDVSGEITHFVGIEQSLEAYEDLEEQFYQSQKMQAVGTLVGGIAHDFNNTLAGITGNLYLAKRDVMEPPKAMHHLQIVEQLAFRAAEIIKQLLTFSRKNIVQMNPISLGPFLKETIKLHRISIAESIDIDLDIEDMPMFIMGDVTMLQQVLVNLVINARDAVQGVKNPSITIRLCKYVADDDFRQRHPDAVGDDFACLSISDNGCGIKQEYLQHLFDPFFTTKEVGKGTGLGLAMVYGAVQTHGGVIEVDSIEGKGTVVRLCFPLMRSEVAEHRLPQHTGITEGHGETVLLVDDNEDVLAMGVSLLERLRYKVLTATDGSMAIDVYRAHRHEIDACILDLVMPKLDGVAAFRAIRDIDPEVKALFVTGYDRESSLENMNGIKPESILTKPFSVQELSHAVRRLLDGGVSTGS